MRGLRSCKKNNLHIIKKHTTVGLDILLVYLVEVNGSAVLMFDVDVVQEAAIFWYSGFFVRAIL